MVPSSTEKALMTQLVKDLQRQYGTVLKGEGLWRTLGFGSRSSFQRAIEARLVPVPLFPMQGNRGLYALTRDVAQHLTALRSTAMDTTAGTDGTEMNPPSKEDDMS